MLFGMNQAWNRGQKEVTIQLTDRIVISPYAAKRLTMLLSGVRKPFRRAQPGHVARYRCGWHGCTST